MKQSVSSKAAVSSASSELKFKTPQQMNPSTLSSETPKHILSE